MVFNRHYRGDFGRKKSVLHRKFVRRESVTTMTVLEAFFTMDSTEIRIIYVESSVVSGVFAGI